MNDYKNNSNKKTINMFFDIDYDNYKERIKKYIFTHIDLMYNIFDEEFNDNFAKLYILYKKELLENNDKQYTNMLIDFYIYLKEINRIDQEEYFYLIMKLLSIYIYNQKINNETINHKTINHKTNSAEIDLKNVKLVGNKYIKLINLNLINGKINDCVTKIANDNIVMELFVLFIKKENKHTKDNIIFIGEKLSMDYFMYWDSEELYEIIKNHISTYNNRLFASIKKYKNEFIKSYNYKMSTLKELYLDQMSTIYTLKYKFMKENKLFNELITDINAINDEFVKINNTG